MSFQMLISCDGETNKELYAQKGDWGGGWVGGWGVGGSISHVSV